MTDNSMKAYLITDVIMLVMYILVLSFFTFVLVKVNMTKGTSDKCSINLMIVCL